MSQLRQRLRPLLGRDSGTWVGRLRRDLRGRRLWAWHALLALTNRRPGKLNVQIQTASYCDGRCVICPYGDSWHRAHPGRMSDALFERILAQLAPMRLGTFCPYLENEPLLDEAFLPRLARCVEVLRFDRLNIATNALTLDAGTARAMADTLRGVPHEIWVSFHGIDAASYRAAMGIDFGRALRNVVGLLKVADGRGLNVVIRGAGRAVRADGRGRTVHFTQSQMRRFWDGVCRREGVAAPPEVHCFAYHDRAASVRRGGNGSPARRRSLLGFYCDRGDRWLHVLYNGDVILCCNDYHRRTVLGNLARQSVAGVLSGGPFRDCRLEMMGLKPAPADFLCRRCVKPGG